MVVLCASACGGAAAAACSQNFSFFLLCCHGVFALCGLACSVVRSLLVVRLAPRRVLSGRLQSIVLERDFFIRATTPRLRMEDTFDGRSKVVCGPVALVQLA